MQQSGMMARRNFGRIIYEDKSEWCGVKEILSNNEDRDMRSNKGGWCYEGDLD